MATIRLPNGWSPRPYQLPSWKAWEAGCRRELLIWHRRAGKDDVALHKAAVAAHMRPATYWHMLPEYAQARKAIWNAVNPHTGKRRIDEAFPKALRASTNEQEMFIRFKTGSTWQVVGSDRYDSLVGTPPAGVVLSEWALANPAAWAYLAPILAENGGWASFITTPRGRNHVKTMLDMARSDPAWFTEVLTVEDTGAITLEAIEQQRTEYHSIYGIEQGDALIEQEYWCSFEAAILGAYWGKEMMRAERDGRICSLAHDPSQPVHTAWDLGVGDSTVIWMFQVLAGGVHVLGWYEAHGEGAGHYARMLTDIGEERGWTWGDDWVPHDAKVREWGGGKTRIETLIALKRRPRLVPAHSLADGINAARKTLATTRFDETGCAGGLEALRQYRREWDDKNKVFRETPKHDWCSHSADAFRYLAMAWRQIKVAPPKEDRPVIGIQDATFDQMLAIPQRAEADRV